MITLGLFGDERSSAAAVAVRGQVVSAVHVTEQEGGPSPHRTKAARERALQVANVAARDLDAIVTVDGCPAHGRETVAPAAPTPPVGPSQAAPKAICLDRRVAQAAQVRAGLSGDALVVVLDDRLHGDGALVRVTPSSVEPLGAILGATDLLRAVARVAEVVGANPEHPFGALRALAEGHQETGDLLSEVIREEDGAIRTDLNRLEQTIHAIQAECPADLASDSPHVRVEQARRTLAGNVLGRASAVIARLASDSARRQAVEAIAFTGDSFASPVFAQGALSRATGARLAPVTESMGAALGAALLPHPNPASITDLSIGPAFSDDEIKAVLDNCRLEYVYEPDWNRLYPRTSQLLKAGAFVGWFQGRSEFGACTLGNRSVLCDPSNRYARENVNVFLLQRSLRHPLPLTLAGSAARDCGFAGDPLRFVPAGRTLDGWRQQLTAVLDSQGHVPLHVPTPGAAPELTRMLEIHRHETGVPGLITVPLAATGLTAVTPRDAIRAMFGSPVDVLVMGRFLVSKDYWLVRRR